MKTKKLFFYLLATILAGCIPVMSLHPLYTEKDVVFEEKLLGTWVDDPDDPEATWEFKRVVDDSNSTSGFNVNRPDEPEKAYELIFSDGEGKQGSFVVHLVKLENALFMDVFPSEPAWDQGEPNNIKWIYNTLFFIPLHTFIKIDSIESQLKMRLTDDDEMEKLLKEDPNAVKHTSVEKTLVLTASTKELQAFVLKYADDSRVFTDETILSRKEPEEPNEPNDTDPNAIDPNED